MSKSARYEWRDQHAAINERIKGFLQDPNPEHMEAAFAEMRAYADAARISGLSLAGTRVYTSRAWPLAEADLPAWRVVAGAEAVEPMTVHAPALQQHELQVDLRGHARAVADLDDALHALAAQALAAVFAAAPQETPDVLDGIASKLQLTLRRIERAMAAEGEAAVGLVVITLRVIFRTYANAPETLI